MKSDKIYNDAGDTFIRAFVNNEATKVNPIDYFWSYKINKRVIVLRDLINLESPELASLIGDDAFIKYAQKGLEEYFDKINNVELDPKYLTLFETTRKKDQINLLKNVTISPIELFALIFKSYEHGYLYSRYCFKNTPPGFEKRKLPQIYRLLEDKSIEKFGETDLSDGELKHIITQRKVIVSNFLEKDDFWHCFFITYKSIGGEENWKNGQPHYHYISSSFGVSREDFIESMKNGKYLSTSVHIDLLGFGEQPEKAPEAPAQK